MWTCPKCGREFKRTNQGHYCGTAPATVLEYIESQPQEARPHLSELTAALRTGIPQATERIRWSMPYFEVGERSISFSACNRHVSLYVGAQVIAEFASRLEGLETKKNAIYLPYDKAFPTELVTDLALRCLVAAGQ